MRQGAVERGQHGRVAPKLEVQRVPALGRVLLDTLGGHQPAGHARHEDVVELQSLGLMDRHDLDRVVIAWLHGFPFLLVELFDGVDVVQERAQRELALHRLEAMDLVQERRQVAPALSGDTAVDVGVQLVQDADAADHLAEELGDGPARLRAQLRQLVAELL